MNFGFRFKGNEISENFKTVDSEIIAKRIEERKKVEESDNQLTNELFSLSPNKTCKDNEIKNLKPPIFPKNKKNLKIDVAMINKSYRKKDIKYSKKPLAKEKDTFGETSLDDIDQLACKIEEAYLYSLD